MKKQFLLFSLTLILFPGCRFGGSETTKTGNLHVIDISKTHPKKDVLLQSIADLEYIPLETTDDILLSGV
ncbi:MAG: 6-bladed beta-propeller, partial [Tannerella sp.]|nr:6-bladed beta-propeller [Tannerella sp.]